MKNYYWTLESWGDQEPPENADEIIEWANAFLDKWISDHPNADENLKKDITETLWDHFCCYDDHVREIIDGGNFNSTVVLMDDEIREAIHAEYAPCSDYIFLLAYMFQHNAKYGETFTI